MNPPITWLLVALAVCIIFFTGCATRGKAMRPTNGKKGDPGADVLPADAWYIQSKPADGSKPYSCSFVEFDERGDYLDFTQQRRSWEKIKELSFDQKEELLLVMYCHGWKNNSQSGDVLSFNRFLGRLAASPDIQKRNLRVHGVYLAWRGNSFKHAINKESDEYRQTTSDFGGPVVNDKYRRKIPFLLAVPELLSYWSRKGAAEAKVSGVPMARTIFTCANAAKHASPPGRTNHVFVIGHSFGALMLEKSLGQACVGALTGEWPWDFKSALKAADAQPPRNPLPFDCVLFVNSAAPSIHSKELSDLLWAHKSALARANLPDADAPVIISVTSSADWATHYVHRIANVLAPLNPSLWRSYDDGVLADSKQAGQPPVEVPQAYFYEHTPGHNPLLVDHWIVPAVAGDTSEPPPANKPVAVLQHNLNFTTKYPEIFYTSAPRAKSPAAWKIGTEANPPGWSQYERHAPVKRGNYWIIRCDKPLIRGHNDVWSPTTMELYAALYRLAEVKRE